MYIARNVGGKPPNLRRYVTARRYEQCIQFTYNHDIELCIQQLVSVTFQQAQTFSTSTTDCHAKNIQE